MPATLPDAWKLLDAKQSIPAELRTAEWAMLPQWLRERAFYMAGVSQAELLDTFRGEVSAIAAGKASIPEAEKRLSQYLDASGYQPAPGQQGTIKDLSFWRRMRVSLRTNVELLQGWGQQQRGLQRGAMMAFPAWELVRIMARHHPRHNPDWHTRWSLAGGKLHAGRMIALKDSPVWLELGSFSDGMGVDYPPFAWGSGMGWRAIGLSDAEKLGVIPADWSPPPRRAVSSPNETLECTPQISERALRDELERRMRGLAEWQGDKLIFTDPNGTRPLPPAKIVETWAMGMPEAFHDLPGNGLMQRDAAIRWVGDHEQFRDQNDTNAWEDLLRLQDRILSRPVERLWRGMAMATEKLDQFLSGLAHGVYSTRNDFPLESWTDSQAAAVSYARSGGNGWSVILNVTKPAAAADLTPLVRSFAAEVAKQSRPPVVTESEWAYATGQSFKVLKVTKDPATRRVLIEVEERP